MHVRQSIVFRHVRYKRIVRVRIQKRAQPPDDVKPLRDITVQLQQRNRFLRKVPETGKTFTFRTRSFRARTLVYYSR